MDGIIDRIKLRTHLCADGLIRTLRSRFERIPEPSRQQPQIPLADALMSGFAVHSLKCPSLLDFDRHRNEGNLCRLFLIDRVPSDSQMRDILDELDPEELRPAFTDIFRHLQRGGAIRRFQFLKTYYLVALDGTQYFESDKIHCPSCLVKIHQNGKVSYSHQMLGAAIVHPDLREVIPLCPEPIVKQDGTVKNDCERNAAKRMLPKLRRDHPHLEIVIIEDGLASNAPHIRDLQDNRFHYILGAKPGDHAYLFEEIERRKQTGQAEAVSRSDPKTGRLQVCWMALDVPLNESNLDLRVNFFDYAEIDMTSGEYIKHFSWVTDLPLDKRNVWEMARGGRARWKIENETFNTLKNQGYHYEHNFGHGNKNLSVVIALLMMLAFLVDQAQQLCCRLFQATWKKFGSKRSLWESMRGRFEVFELCSMQQLFESLLYGFARAPPPIKYPSGTRPVPAAIDSS